MKKDYAWYTSKGYAPEVAEYFASGRRKIAAVAPHKDYTLTITFDNGERRLYDVSPHIERGKVSEPLLEWENFKRVYLDASCSICWDLDPSVDSEVVWSNKFDLCPDSCYIYSVPIEEEDDEHMRKDS